MEKVLTVVVPAYNAEVFLENCLDSLCLPDLLDLLEVIVVDDGSTDRTGSLADGYQARFPRTVRVIHKENGGHGSGINCGIKAASGRYFKVVDADDWVEAEGLRNLVRFLERFCVGKKFSASRREPGADEERAGKGVCAGKKEPGEPDIPDAVVSGFYWAFDDGRGREAQFRRKAEIREPFPGVVYGKVYLFDQVAERIYVKMHGLTIRTELLRKQGKRIDEKCFYVDLEYILYPVPFIKTIAFIRDFVYQYRIGRQGQSMDPARMLRLEADYDRVMGSLLKFYDQCAASGECSQEKCAYIARIIARAAAGKVKILLSAPYGKASRARLIAFERKLKKHYPAVYAANENRAVSLLRFSRYRLYPAAFGLLQIQNRRR